MSDIRYLVARVAAFVFLGALALQAWADETLWRRQIASQRGTVPVVLVNHRPNIDRLTMELIDEGELLVGRAKASEEIDVLGRIKVP